MINIIYVPEHFHRSASTVHHQDSSAFRCFCKCSLCLLYMHTASLYAKLAMCRCMDWMGGALSGHPAELVLVQKVFSWSAHHCQCLFLQL